MIRLLLTLTLFITLGFNVVFAERTTVRPEDTGEALVNPMMGWTMHYYSNIPTNYGSKLAPSDTLDDFPGLSTVYLRIPWAFIEPEEGRYNWAILDTPAQRWIDKGKYIALRITCSENWMQYATPKWVKDAGAVGYHYEFGKGRSDRTELPWDPKFDDPVFLEKLENFLRVMGERYNGNPNVAFIDVGTYGMWGEGHTFMSSKVPEKDNLAITKIHIDLHKKYFPDQLLCISDDVVGHNKPGTEFPETDYALSQGVSLRDDSIMVQPPPNSWYHSALAERFWPIMPVILEHEHYGSSRDRKAWSDELFQKSVEDYHASFMSIHWWARVLLDENRETIDKINRRLGYRLQLREMTWPDEIVAGQWFTITSRWANVGVAPCYPGGFVTVTLKDNEGGIVSVITDASFDMKSLKPDNPGKAESQTVELDAVVGKVAPVVLPGEYDLFVSVGTRDGTPKIALPLSGNDGHRRYHLGRIRILE
ncbi:MAG: DUF4832 domain-containing protein [Thermoguttaceae bacterium]